MREVRSRGMIAVALALFIAVALLIPAVSPVISDIYDVVDDIDIAGGNAAGSPARVLSASTEAVTLKVDSPEGSLPAGANARITNLTSSEIESVKTDAEALLGVQVVDAVAFDISFEKGLREIEPDGAVEVTVNFPEIADADSYRIVHFCDDGTVEIVPGTVTRTSATFSADRFSVYAVIGTTGYKRMTVNFYNGTTLVGSMIVKDSDTAEELKTIVYDPGIGATPLAADQAFLGWSLEQNYKVNTTAYTIDGIRNYIKGMTYTDGGTLNVYARIFQVYTVTYLVKAGVSLGSDPVFVNPGETTAEYSVTQSFTPELDTQNFDGWTVAEGAANISEYTEGKIYKLDDSLTISGDIALQVLINNGHWLIFDENAKGATYNAPQFYKTADKTSDEDLLDMHRTGYEFGGWFYFPEGVTVPAQDDKGTRDLTNAQPFTFGEVLTENTTVYAKWIINTTADYTILIWKQNVSGNGYDFAESVRINGTVGENIDTVSSAGTGNGAYAIVNNSNKQYQGFHLDRFDQEVPIVPEGTSVLNVYYNRNEVTLTFLVYSNGNGYSKTEATTGELYGLVDGSYVRIYSDDNGATWYTTSGSEYVEITSESDPHYGLVNGEYILLTKIGDNWYYYDAEGYAANEAGTEFFGIVGDEYVALTYRDGKYYYVSGTEYVYTQTNGNGGTQYGIVGGEYILLHRSGGNWYYYSYTASDATDSTMYGLIDGEYRALVRRDMDDSWFGTDYHYFYNNVEYTDQRYTRSDVRYRDTRYTRSEKDVETEYTGTVYTHNIPYTGDTFYKPATVAYTGDRYVAQGAGWKTAHIMKGLYGAPLSSSSTDDKVWPTDYWWYDKLQGQDNRTRTTFLDAFLLANGGSSQTFYGYEGTGSRTVYFYKWDGNISSFNISAPTNTVATSNGTFYISDKYNGYKAHSYSTNGTNWTNLGDKGSNGYYGSVETYTTLYIRFAPVNYSISFMDGVYQDGNGKPVAGYGSRGQLKVVTGVSYNSDLTSYNKGNTNYYAPTFDEFTFVGWFVDDACTQPYTFTTMPEGLTVYAKWIQNQYRVFLHSNADGDDTLDWGSDSQAMSFRISSGSKISLPNGLRADYQMIGWYVDAKGTIVYSKDTNLSDSFKHLQTYDKTRYTDYLDKHGTLIENDPDKVPYNSDIVGYNGGDRFWITKSLDLYAKWSAAIPGADGISVIYTAGTLGTGAPTDSLLYKDNVDAIAGAAAKSSNADYVFSHWVVQKWDATNRKYVDTNVTVEPGAAFTVLKANAYTVVLSYESDGETIKEATYTVQLRAEYKKVEKKTPTHIYWYDNYSNENDGKGKLLRADENLAINQAVDILAAPTRENFTFLGWTKTKGGTTADFLVWNGTAYKTAGTSGVAVTQVAADEKDPIEDLYAVWKELPKFYVYHSGVDGGNIETVHITNAMLAQDYAGYDLTANLTENTLYGGYYLEGGFTAPEAVIGETGGEALIPAYNGTNWIWTDPQTADGRKLIPEANVTYYIKEVPDIYLTPYTHIGYLGDVVKSLLIVTAVDDLTYNEAGFNYIIGDGEAVMAKAGSTFTGSLTITTTIGDSKYVITASDVNADITEKTGYVGYLYLTGENIAPGKTISVNQWWETPDGVIVAGTVGRIISTGDGTTGEAGFSCVNK